MFVYLHLFNSSLFFCGIHCDSRALLLKTQFFFVSDQDRTNENLKNNPGLNPQKDVLGLHKTHTSLSRNKSTDTFAKDLKAKMEEVNSPQSDERHTTNSGKKRKKKQNQGFAILAVEQANSEVYQQVPVVSTQTTSLFLVEKGDYDKFKNTNTNKRKTGVSAALMISQKLIANQSEKFESKGDIAKDEEFNQINILLPNGLKFHFFFVSISTKYVQGANFLISGNGFNWTSIEKPRDDMAKIVIFIN